MPTQHAPEIRLQPLIKLLMSPSNSSRFQPQHKEENQPKTISLLLNKKKKETTNKTTNTTHKPNPSHPTHLPKVPLEYIVQTPPENPTPQAIGGRRLSWSTEVFQLTPRLHQTHLLWEPSSPKGEWLPIFGRGFGLRCFQPLSSAAWLPGVCPIGQPVN